MGLWDQVTRVLALEPWREPVLQTREMELPTLEQQIARLRNNAVDSWRVPSVSEALSVPAVFRAVTLISNTIGSLTMEAFRNETKLDADQRPSLVKRPNPRQTPGDFFRETARAMATYGEAWWWIAKRDGDDVPLSLWPVPPIEVFVTLSDDRRFPKIAWGQREMRNEDMIQLVLTREPGALRGQGPLQACGAAVSVAVESQRWAAKFFASPIPSVNLHNDGEFDEGEADALKLQFYEKAANDNLLITSGPMQLREFGINTQSAQLLDSRFSTVGDMARAFGIPGPLLEWSMGGASLTYQNRDQLIRSLFDQCIRPDYLEPMEQAMSDLLTRSTTARFNLDDQLRADIKTRFEVYELGVAKAVGPDGRPVMSIDEARAMEGLAPGNVENAPVPLSPPQAEIPLLPVQMREDEDVVRCRSCGKSRFVVESTDPLRLRCVRCKTLTQAEPQEREALTQQPIVVNVAAPIVNVSPADVHVDAPIVNLPEQKPIELKVSMETPEGVERVERMAKEAGEATAAVKDMGGRIIDFTASVASLHERVDEVAAEAKKPRRYVPERDTEGRIVAVTQR